LFGIVLRFEIHVIANGEGVSRGDIIDLEKPFETGIPCLSFRRFDDVP
jgi:hypothetical protein